MQGRIGDAIRELGIEKGRIYWFGERLLFRGIEEADKQRIRNVFHAEGFVQRARRSQGGAGGGACPR
ncbi:MAG: hypothetical protein JXP34_20720 [Planctomycetes bacterium]|nr:hypothetical protein [Planctomycetota bacterium]